MVCRHLQWRDQLAEFHENLAVCLEVIRGKQTDGHT
jgi:hypothetical protein